MPALIHDYDRNLSLSWDHSVRLRCTFAVAPGEHTLLNWHQCLTSMGTDAVNILRPHGLFTTLLKGVSTGLKERLITVTSHELSVQVAINSWRLVLERTNKTLSHLTDDQLLKEVAPGRNRLIYLWGHLTAVHDAMFPILGLGERLHPELDAIFVSSPDKTEAQFPSVGELRTYWDEVNGKLLSQFADLSEDEWLHRHNSVSEGDFAKDPTRNRLAVLLSRTNHMSYHLGQITLALK
jgi:uncharacterized damage-inducible protein DinB